jgi:SAM-dependent methyltransferase
MIGVSGACRRCVRMPWRALAANKLHEWVVKATGRRIAGQGMIGAEPARVASGFAGLRGKDFYEYNLPQMWVERRQIPSAIDGRIPVRGAVVLDLGCGPGTSTEVLAHFADPSWTIVGYELTEHLAAEAKARSERGEFVNCRGERVPARFVCQDISRPLRAPGGGLIAEGSVDFAVSGGVVGLYMNARSVTRLAQELARVVRPGGFAALDTGPAVGGRLLREVMARAGFGFVATCRSFVIEPRPKLVFVRHAGAIAQAA